METAIKGKKPHGLEAGDCDKRFSALQAKVFSLLVFSDSWKSPTELKHRDLKARKCLVFLNVSRAKRLSHCEQLTKRFYRAVETLQSRQIIGISLKIKKNTCAACLSNRWEMVRKIFPSGNIPAANQRAGYGTLKRLWDKEPGPSPNKAKMVSSSSYFSLLFELPTVYLLLLLVFSVWHGFFQKLSWFPFFEVFFFWKKKRKKRFCWLWFLMRPTSPPPLLGNVAWRESIVSLTPAADWMGGHWSWDVETRGRCCPHLISTEAGLDASQEWSFTCRASSALLCRDNSIQFGSIGASPVCQRSSSLAIVESVSAVFLSVKVNHRCQYSWSYLYQHKSSLSVLSISIKYWSSASL